MQLTKQQNYMGTFCAILHVDMYSFFLYTNIEEVHYVEALRTTQGSKQAIP